MLRKGSKGGARLSNSNGFTLVEILVVLAILAMLIPIFLLVVTHTVNLNNEARLRSGATLLAEGLAEALLAERISPGTSGVQPPYSWVCQAGPAVHAELQQVTISVTWSYRGKQRQVDLVTYMQVTT